MKPLKHKIITVLAVMAAIGLVAMPFTASAATTSTPNSDIGNLVVLDRVFNDNGNLDLGDLVIWDVLFQGDTTIASDTTFGGNLGNLIVLDALFNNDNNNGLFNNNNLQDLVVWEALFNGTTLRSGTAKMNGSILGGDATIENLIIWDALFNDDNNNGTLSKNKKSKLEDLIVWDTLFAGGGTVTGGRVVTVERGDTLSEIAQKFLGDSSRWPEIANLNNISDPTTIQPGQKLRLPSSGTANLQNLIIWDALFNDNNGLFD